MPRFTPWHLDASPDQHADILMEVVVRPNLRKAFALPREDSPEAGRFRQMLAVLAQRTGPERRTGRQGA